MSGFSPEWLALREAIDHRSRDAALARQMAAPFKQRPNIAIIDVGCGTGSNLRATAPVLDVARQHWTLVDYDARLLAAASERLAQWADRAIKDDDGLVLFKGVKTISVTFRQADLVKALDVALGETADLVTASAFFDLCSAEFIERFAAAVAKRRAAFYTVLTYNGMQDWLPPHKVDAGMAAAFHAHQMTDKGFGAAAGPMAPAALCQAFARLGYGMSVGDSPWRLTERDQGLIDALVPGFAGAVSETGTVGASAVADWLAVRRTGAVVGHTDTLAMPG